MKPSLSSLVSFSIKWFQLYLEEIHLSEKLTSFSLWFNELNQLGKEGFGKLNGEARRSGREKYVELEGLSMDMVKTQSCTRFANNCHLNIMKTSVYESPLSTGEKLLMFFGVISSLCGLCWSLSLAYLRTVARWGGRTSWQSSLLLHSCLTMKKTTSVFKRQACGAVKGYVYTMDLPSEVSSGGGSFFPPRKD